MSSSTNGSTISCSTKRNSWSASSDTMDSEQQQHCSFCSVLLVTNRLFPRLNRTWSYATRLSRMMSAKYSTLRPAAIMEMPGLVIVHFSSTVLYETVSRGHIGSVQK